MTDPIRKQLYNLVGWLYSRVPALARDWGRRFDALQFDQVPFVPMRVPLAQARIALITTGGVHRRDQPPFDMVDPTGDATFRVIAADTDAAELTITHDYYDHRDAEEDLNILLPIALIRELVAAGHIGAVGTSYSFMGHIEPPHLETLLRTTAPQVAGMLKQEQIDAVLLTPA
jgi:D-proline reductase (dithiol) PrdB